MEENFQSFPLSRIYPDESLPGDLFLFLSGHFVKYKSADDTLPLEKYNHFLMKRLGYLFIRINDAQLFEAWSNKLSKKEDQIFVSRVGEAGADLVDLRKELKGELFDLFTGDIDDEAVIRCMDTTRRIIDRVNDNSMAKNAMAKLVDYNNDLASHSLNVAYLSVHLAQSLGYNHQIILENIYLGALLHDFGKTRIDPKYFEDEANENYDKAMMAHPELGRTTLKERTELSDEVLRIVAEHHERNDGCGYPNGLKGSQIYELTKIVSIVNSFFDFISISEGTFQEKKAKAIFLIENDNGHMFDAKKAAKCVGVLKALP